jgi:ketosteroid isomerase-like protein
MTGQPQADTSEQERNRRFVIRHFDEFVNNKDLDAVIRNMSEDFYDHDGPSGKPTDRHGDRSMMEQLHRLLPDLRVQVVDSLAEGDKVMVRNIWTGTHAKTGQRMEFHGFVLWRLAGGKIVERWATVTPQSELTTDTLDW